MGEFSFWEVFTEVEGEGDGRNCVFVYRCNFSLVIKNFKKKENRLRVGFVR